VASKGSRLLVGPFQRVENRGGALSVILEVRLNGELSPPLLSSRLFLILNWVSNWTAFFTANPEALQDRTVTQAAFGSAFGDAVGTALLAPTSSNLMTVFSTIAGNGFSPNTVRGLVANALIDNAEGLYTAGVSLTALPRHVLLQGNSTGGRANIPCGPASP
jgi:hypothetical protein